MKNKRITRVSLLLLVAVAFLLPAISNAAPNIAIVDMQFVLENIKEGKRIKEQLNKDASGRQELIEKKKKDIEKLETEFQQKRLVWKGDTLQKKQAELESKTVEFQKLLLESRNDFKKRENEEVQKLLGKIRGVVTKVGVDKKFDMVIEKTSVYYFKDNFDVTDQIISAYDKQYK